MKGISFLIRKNSIAYLSMRRWQSLVLMPAPVIVLTYFTFAALVGADVLSAPFQIWPMARPLSFFLRPYHRLTMPREKNTAENIEVRIPRQCTTAKPRIAPEPKISSARPAIKVVTLESTIVAQAR